MPSDHISSPHDHISSPESEQPRSAKKHLPIYTGAKSKIPPTPLGKLSSKHLALKVLRESGKMTDTQIATALGYSKTYLPALKRNLELHSIVTPQIQRAAKKALLETLELKPVTRETAFKGEITTYEDKPTHRDRMDAVREVMSRTDVVKTRTESLSIHGNMSAEGFSSALGELMTYKPGNRQSPPATAGHSHPL